MAVGTRIRYKKETDNVLTTKNFVTENGLFKGVIQLNTPRVVSVVKVTNYHNGNTTPVSCSEYKDVAAAKRFVKTELKKLGVTFFDEVRNKAVTL